MVAHALNDLPNDPFELACCLSQFTVVFDRHHIQLHVQLIRTHEHRFVQPMNGWPLQNFLLKMKIELHQFEMLNKFGVLLFFKIYKP